jgi:hypothetical protein
MLTPAAEKPRDLSGRASASTISLRVNKYFEKYSELAGNAGINILVGWFLK